MGANRYPLPQQGAAKPDWFHRDEGTLDPSSSPAQPRRSFTYNVSHLNPTTLSDCILHARMLCFSASLPAPKGQQLTSCMNPLR